MDLGLTGKTAIITGGSRGIGRATAHAFADEGANVAICARGSAALEQCAGELRAKGAKVIASVADMTKKADVERFVAEVADTLGRIDVLVNNTGGTRGRSLLDTTEAEWQESADLNF